MNNSQIIEQKKEELLKDYIFLLKPRYKSKDGTIKKGIEKIYSNGYKVWLAPKNDI